jgi:hypothetical protein
MSTRQVFCVILSLSMFLGLCHVATAKSVPTDAEMPSQQAKEEDDLKELNNQIRREKFDLVLPQVMRKNNIDMWIHVMREGSPDPMRDELGSTNGVFIFTDRGVDRIERAVIGHRWKSPARRGAYGRTPFLDVVRECGAYDIIAEEFIRREKPGGPKTEFDHRFKGVGEFVAERGPKRIAVNYLEKLGPPVVYSIPRLRSDGISYTDYNLLVKALGDRYAKRMVSAEYLMYDYLSRRVESEIVMFKKIRKWIAESLERDIAKIVVGVTKFSDLEGGDSVVDKEGNRRRGDYVIQGGDWIKLGGGKQSHHYLDSEWKFGNFYEVVDAYAYVLRKGETEPPPKIKKTWADALKVRKILEDNIKMGRTAGETFEILKRKIEEAGFIYVNRQIYNKDLDLEKTQVPLDLHAAGKGIYAPRIGPLGPDWQRDLPLQLNHHFYFEYWVYVPMPEWGEGRYLSLRFHDGAMVNERGVEYFAPPPTELHLIK